MLFDNFFLLYIGISIFGMLTPRVAQLAGDHASWSRGHTLNLPLGPKTYKKEDISIFDILKWIVIEENSFLIIYTRMYCKLNFNANFIWQEAVWMTLNSKAWMDVLGLLAVDVCIQVGNVDVALVVAVVWARDGGCSQN
jgi:hypothetical protein